MDRQVFVRIPNRTLFNDSPSECHDPIGFLRMHRGGWTVFANFWRLTIVLCSIEIIKKSLSLIKIIGQNYLASPLARTRPNQSHFLLYIVTTGDVASTVGGVRQSFANRSPSVCLSSQHRAVRRNTHHRGALLPPVYRPCVLFTRFPGLFCWLNLSVSKINKLDSEL